MKLIAILTAPCAVLAASWTNSGSKDVQLVASSVSAQDLAGCVSYAESFITKPTDKDRAVSRAMDHCALDKKVDDNNFVCPHFREILTSAFRREPTTQKYTAKTFCDVAEAYVADLQSAAKVPNMGKGDGFGFTLSKGCKATVLASFSEKAKKLPAKSAPDFWYALCMNQDCAHFLPSRTRWCNKDHAPTHTQSVCEAVRSFAFDDIFVMEKNFNKDLDADQMCSIYDEFVEATHINVEAYMHVVHGTDKHPVPSPANQKRALDSAKMKNEAGKNKIADSAEPVKSAAATKAPLFFAFTSLAGFLMCRM